MRAAIPPFRAAPAGNKALAYRENKDSEEIRELLRSEKLQVPPEVRYILGMDDLQRGAEYRLGILHRIQQRFNWIRGKFLSPSIFTRSQA